MKLTLTGLLFVFLQIGFSCDNCNLYVGVSPDDAKHSIGVYFRNRMMMGHYSPFGIQTLQKHANHGNNQSFWGNQVTESYCTYELRAKIVLNKRLRTYFILPVVNNRQYIAEQLISDNVGVGDPIIMQGVHVLDPTAEYSNPNFTQRLEFCAGIKLPIGSITQEQNETLLNLDLQPGSGSWDILGMMKYLMRIKNFGLAFNTSYSWRNFNGQDYKYGNSFNSEINLFYQTKMKQFTLLPTAGMSVEQATFDQSSEIHLDTGGQVFFIQGGLKFYLKGFQLFGEFQKAISNQMNGYTQLITKYKINAGIAYNF